MTHPDSNEMPEVPRLQETSRPVGRLPLPGRAPEYGEPTVAPGRQASFCQACGAQIDARAALCTRCGVAQHQMEPPRTHPQAAVGLVLNIFFPGVGTLVLGQTTVGAIQLALWLVSIPLAFLIIGWPLYFGVWVWALIVAIQAFSNYRPPTAPAPAMARPSAGWYPDAPDQTIDRWYDGNQWTTFTRPRI